MRRVLPLALLLLAAPVWGATVYIDGGCTNNGDGTAIDCAASAGAAGPYNSLGNVFPSIEACGNTYTVRGVHSTHGSNHAAGTFNGRYFGNEWAADQNCDGNPSIIQPYNYGASQERVYLDGTRCPHPSGCANCDATACEGQDAAGEAWEQCDWNGSTCDCHAGTGQGIQIGAGGSTACEQTWFTSDDGTAGTGFQSGTAALMLWAQKDDGSPTQMVTSAANMTNATAGYNDDRCTNSADSAQKWMPCTVNADCLTGETCSSGASPEVDCFTDTAPAPDVMLCRWGASLPTRPYVAYTAAGVGFTLKPATDSWTVRGFDFRVHRKASVFVDGDTGALDRGDHMVEDNRIFFTTDPQGSDYGVVTYQVNRTTVRNNEIAYTNSEAIHCNSYASASASVVTMQSNYIHNQGDANIMGAAATTGTAQVGITCNPAENTSSTGNLTGSVIEKNLIVDTKTYGIRMEHCVTGIVIRDNVLLRAGSNLGLLIDASPQGSCAGAGTCCNNTSSNQEWYNNLIISQGQECAQVFTYADANTTNVIDGLKFYNNTCISPGADGGIKSDTFTGTFSNNIIRNNIFYTGALQGVNIAAPASGAGNVFEYNLIYHTGGGTAATWLGTTKDCASIPDLGTGNLDDCPDPVFVGAADFNLQTTSPAKNAGTSTGMPSGRTVDLCNTLADDHGLANYNHCIAAVGTVDIGALEFSSTAKRRILVTVSP